MCRQPRTAAMSVLPSSTQYLSRMTPRNPDEVHRAATPLELLFDLVSVIAIAAAAAGLHHALAHNHVLSGLLYFSASFFMIWWAWMNYTWFASAYDNDDVVFRLLTLVIMAGALTLAAGIKPLFEGEGLVLVLIGFMIMRLAMMSLWIRAGLHDAAGRATAYCYAVGIFLVQLYWIVLILSNLDSASLFWMLFALGAVFELSVPVVAERFGKTAWHRHHMVERYGLLTIIVLGETLLAAAIALGKLDFDHLNWGLVRTAANCVVILGAMWWVYFAREEHLQGREVKAAFVWGYGHFLIYAAAAAVGAGLALMVDVVNHDAHITIQAAQMAVAIPVGLYFIGLWLVRDRYALSQKALLVLPVMALLIVLVAWLLPLEAVSALAVVTVIWRSSASAAVN